MVMNVDKCMNVILVGVQHGRSSCLLFELHYHQWICYSQLWIHYNCPCISTLCDHHSTWWVVGDFLPAIVYNCFNILWNAL